MVSGTETKWSGGEGSIDRDEGMGGVLPIAKGFSVPGPLLEIRAVEQGGEGEVVDRGGAEGDAEECEVERGEEEAVCHTPWYG